MLLRIVLLIVACAAILAVSADEAAGQKRDIALSRRNNINHGYNPRTRSQPLSASDGAFQVVRRRGPPIRERPPAFNSVVKEETSTLDLTGENCTGIVDLCGVCNGTSFDPMFCRRGCDGKFGSPIMNDACGVCGGDDSTCDCDTTRIVAWTVFMTFFFLAPLFIYALFRLWVFTFEGEVGWLVTQPLYEVTNTGHGAYRTKLARDAYHNALVHTIIFTIITWISVGIRFSADYLSSLRHVCHNLDLFATYSGVILTLLAFAGLCAAIRYFVYARRELMDPRPQ